MNSVKKILRASASPRFVGVAVVGIMLVAGTAYAQNAEAPAAPKPSEYDELFLKYLAEARATAQAPQTPDSLWMAGLNGDLRARRVNDLVTIRAVRVSESLVLDGKVLYVDDGECPKGEIKEVTGGSSAKGIARKVRCITRPPKPLNGSAKASSSAEPLR